VYKISTKFSKEQKKYMLLAIKLAKKGAYSVKSNPIVGCVIVKHNRIIGTGFHQKAGGKHAEINALDSCQENPRNSDVYVSLEPCCVQGKTPACTNALIKAKVARVFFATYDPNPAVAGRGQKILEKAKIKTYVGLLQKKAYKINIGFFHRMLYKKPLITLKIAQSLDGKISMDDGESKWITNKYARADSHKIRAKSCAILTTSDTVIADNPQMNVRLATKKNITQPVVIIVDRKGKLNHNVNIFRQSRHIIILTEQQNYPVCFQQKSVDIIYQQHLDIKNILETITRFEFNNIMVECGGSFATALIKEHVFDVLTLYIAPKILGTKSKAVFMPVIKKLADAPYFKLQKVTRIKDNIKLILTRK
jgi:diaminohydroxyphosphoribosylaminopyrimidine deaminase / 5-amino-6-(5-phosphoribosylamino)uracil reductase